MRNFLSSFLIFLIWFGLAFAYSNYEVKANIVGFLSSEKPKATTTQNITSDKNPADNDLKTNTALLTILDENNEVLMSLDTIYFEKNNENVVLKTTPQSFFSQLTDYLDNHSKTIEINSFYSADENYSSPNIGFKRAKHLEKLLVDSGIRINTISIKTVLKDIEFNDNQKAFGQFQLVLKDNESNLIDIDNLNRDVYPEFTFSKIIVNDELREYGKLLKEYLDQNPNRNVLIIGHTDHIGSQADTYELGFKYARQARAYLINAMRIDARRLVALSLGKENPVADNATEDGRKKNLRIEFKVE